jgi:hypothetical protein
VAVSAGEARHTVYAKVIEDKTGSLAPGENMADGNSDNGVTHSIYAHNFRINEIDANALAAQAGTANYAAEFLTRAGVQGYSRTNALAVAGTPTYVSDTGFASSGVLEEGDTFTVTYRIAEDTEASVTIKVFVSNANPPVLTVPLLKEFALGHSITDAEYREGVVATDVEDTALNIPLVINYDASAVNINKHGFYNVTYSVTDSDHNTVTQDGIIFINDGSGAWDKDSGVEARSFVTGTKSITAALAAGKTLEQIILERSHAVGLRIDLSNPAQPVIVVDNRILKVNDDAGFSSLARDYNGIKIGVDPVAGLEGRPEVEIDAKVIDKDIISTDPAPDASNNDENKDDPNDSYRYLVGAQSPVSIRIAEVPEFAFGTPTQTAAAKAKLIERAQAEAFKFHNDMQTVNVDVIANDIPTNASAGNTYYVTFAPAGVPSVWVRVVFEVIEGNAPVLTVDGSLVVDATDDTRVLSRDDLMQGVTATDEEAKTPGNPNGDISSSVQITDDNNRAPAIDTSKPGFYPIEYAVADEDGNEVSDTRTVVVNDGRYKPIDTDEPEDGEIDIFIGAKNYVVKQSEVANTVQHVRAKSWAEAYDTKGNDLSSQLILVDGIPAAYAAGTVGTYTFTWALRGYSTDNGQGGTDLAKVKTITAKVVPNDFEIDPGADTKDSKFAVIARDFTMTTSRAENIRTDADYIAAAQADVIELIEGMEDKQPTTTDTGGFSSAQGRYLIKFGVRNPANTYQAGLSVGIDGVVTRGQAPILSSDEPIYFPTVAAAGTNPYDQEQIKTQGRVGATDAEDGNITSSVTVTDPRTGSPLMIPSDQKGVYQAKLSVTDSDGNTVEKIVGVSVGIVPGDFMIDANDFTIDSRDVVLSMVIEQIIKESGAKAWKRDGTPVAVSVLSTGGYNPAAGVYRPVLGVNDTAQYSKTITATVVDNATRYTVTFNANGGSLTGPDRITVVFPNTLPYLPSSPIRDGYVFLHWATTSDGGEQFTSSTPIDDNITVYAQWRFIPVPDEPDPVDPPVVNIYPPAITVNPPDVTVNPGGGGATYVTVTPEPAAAPDINVTVEQPAPTEGTPIAPETPPLSLPTPEPTFWSLFNLIAAILSLLLLLVFAIKLFFDRPKNEEYEEEAVDSEFIAIMTPDQREQYQRRREADYQTWLADQERENKKQKAFFVNLPVLLIAGLAFVEAFILLFMTQDFYGIMQFVDSFSVIFALILFVQLITPMVAAVIHNSNKEKRAARYQKRENIYDGNVTL